MIDKTMIYIYRIYQWCIVSPIMLVLSILTALVTIVGCLFNEEYWGYYPAKWWARTWCLLHLVKVRAVGRELIDHERTIRLLEPYHRILTIDSEHRMAGSEYERCFKLACEEMLGVCD